MQAHSLGTIIHKPTVKPLAPRSCLPIKDPSSGPGKHCHQPSARSPPQQGAVHRNSQVSFALRTWGCQMGIHPVAHAESRAESFWDLPQAISCYWAAPRERRTGSCKPFYAQFIPILHIVKQWFVSYAEKIKYVGYPSMPSSLGNKKQGKGKGFNEPPIHFYC